jgi:ATP-binding cassette subfamily F protein 3
MKLIAGELGALKGDVTRAGKLRIGYFSQHQTEELDVNSTPYHEMFKLMHAKNPDVKEPMVRAKLGAFKFSRDLADNRIADLSGGEKARLLFAFMSFDAPHLLLLDEPTNHLDVDAREALVHALNAYEGAIVIVSHDPNMVERVADQLWVVKDGACTNFDGDLDDYRAFTVESRRAERKKEKQSKTVSNDSVKSTDPKNIDMSPSAKKKTPDQERRAREIEKSIAKLIHDKEKLELQMAEPGFYTSGKDISGIQEKYTCVVNDLEQAEMKWLEIHEG